MSNEDDQTLPYGDVCASAPGKVILFGEHSVVYGQPAVAAALSDLRIQVHASPNSHTATAGGDNVDVPVAAIIRMIMPDLPDPVDCSVPASALLDIQPQLQAPPTAECALQLESMVRHHARHSGGTKDTAVSDQDTIHAILPLLYLMAQLAPAVILQRTGCTMRVRSLHLPVGAGLGSSAAFGVACAAALFQWYTASLTKPSTTMTTMTTTTTPSTESIDAINRYAYYSEVLLHGRPSGIDNTVSSQGGALLFTRCHHQVSLQRINMAQPLQLLLVYTHVPRQTKRLVALVRTLYEEHPAVVTPILQAMGQIATSFCDLVSTASDNSSSSSNSSNSASKMDNSAKNTAKSMLTLVRTNQALLSALGVSHPSLDCICAVVQQQCPPLTDDNTNDANASAAAKLTGAGGGGCAMIVLAAPTTSTGNKATADAACSSVALLRQRLIKALNVAARRNGYHFDFLSSTVGGDGVLYVPPSDFFVPVHSQANAVANRATRDWWTVLIVPAAVATGAALATTLLWSRCKRR